MQKAEGLLVVFSGPSGVGKDTLLKRLLEKAPETRLSVSATTRSPRPGEADGTDYYFVEHSRFEEMIQNGELLEYAQYCGNFYGTPIAPIRAWNNQGASVILEIEVQGAKRVIENCPDCVSIFLLPPSLKVLEQRLRDRQTEKEETIQNRLRTAREEILQADRYDYVVVNDDLEAAVEEIRAIIHAEMHKTTRNQTLIKGVLQTC